MTIKLYTSTMIICILALLVMYTFYYTPTLTMDDYNEAVSLVNDDTQALKDKRELALYNMTLTGLMYDAMMSGNNPEAINTKCEQHKVVGKSPEYLMHTYNKHTNKFDTQLKNSSAALKVIVAMCMQEYEYSEGLTADLPMDRIDSDNYSEIITVVSYLASTEYNTVDMFKAHFIDTEGDSYASDASFEAAIVSATTIYTALKPILN